VPGLDVEVVVANIKNEMMLALSILLGSRRKLRRRREHLGRGPWKQGADPCDKANPNAAGGLETAGKKCSSVPPAGESESYRFCSMYRLHFTTTLIKMNAFHLPYLSCKRTFKPRWGSGSRHRNLCRLFRRHIHVRFIQ